MVSGKKNYLYSWSISLVISVFFAVRYLNCLPFSGYTRVFNYETIATLTSVFLYFKESISFPLGVIKGLTFPFHDANIGNVGAIPLFALAIKLIGRFFEKLQVFDYFIFVELISVFFTAYFTDKINLLLGIESSRFRIISSLLTATSFPLLTRSAFPQTFCVVEFPIFAGWLYIMLIFLSKERISYVVISCIILIFPIAALLDAYALFGVLLATAALLPRECYEFYLFRKIESAYRIIILLGGLLLGILFAVFALFVIGMFPLPPVPANFTSYDFGIGGRYHVADLFSLWIPTGSKYFPSASIFGRMNFPLTDDMFGDGQYEGIAYVGTVALLLWGIILISFCSNIYYKIIILKKFDFPKFLPIWFWSPWRKLLSPVLAVFVFSLGYELHVLGREFPNFTAMPAAWIADRFHPLYNIRAPGRLASLATLYFIIDALKYAYFWFIKNRKSLTHNNILKYTEILFVSILFLIHLLEIAPFIKPVQAVPLMPLGGVFSEEDIIKIRKIGSQHKVALIAPSAKAADVQWEKTAFSLGFYLNIPSNLFYVARVDPSHEKIIDRDINDVLNGNWDRFNYDYGDVVIVLPIENSDKIRSKVSSNFREDKIKGLSIWVSQINQK